MRLKDLLFFALLISLIAACNAGAPFTELPDVEPKIINVSFVSSDGTASVSSLHPRQIDEQSITYDIQSLNDEQYFKPMRTSGARGILRKSITPVSFVLSTSNIFLYRDLYSVGAYEKILYSIGDQSTGEVYQHFDLINSRQVVRDFALEESQFQGFGLKLSLNSDIGSGSVNDGLMVMSEVTLRLGAEYAEFDLEGGIYISELDAHVFTLNFLQPYLTDKLGYIAIGGDIPTDGIQNPEGIEGVYPLPCKIESRDDGIIGSSTLFLNGPAYDFNQFTNPEIVFNWNMADCVQIYDNGTPADYSDDIVTLDVGNPFPISIELRELQSPGVTDSAADTTTPADVAHAHLAGQNSVNTLQWINPIDADFEKVIIVRKAGTAPLDHEDGDIVYEGFTPAYWDTTGESGVHYYYAIYACDFSGNMSGGIVVDQIQN